MKVLPNAMAALLALVLFLGTLFVDLIWLGTFQVPPMSAFRNEGLAMLALGLQIGCLGVKIAIPAGDGFVRQARETFFYSSLAGFVIAGICSGVGGESPFFHPDGSLFQEVGSFLMKTIFWGWAIAGAGWFAVYVYELFTSHLDTPRPSAAFNRFLRAR